MTTNYLNIDSFLLLQIGQNPMITVDMEKEDCISFSRRLVTEWKEGDTFRYPQEYYWLSKFICNNLPMRYLGEPLAAFIDFCFLALHVEFVENLFHCLFTALRPRVKPLVVACLLNQLIPDLKPTISIVTKSFCQTLEAAVSIAFRIEHIQDKFVEILGYL